MEMASVPQRFCVQWTRRYVFFFLNTAVFYESDDCVSLLSENIQWLTRERSRCCFRSNKRKNTVRLENTIWITKQWESKNWFLQVGLHWQKTWNTYRGRGLLRSGLLWWEKNLVISLKACFPMAVFHGSTHLRVKAENWLTLWEIWSAGSDNQLPAATRGRL